jgi:hypothetical protein
MFRKEILDKLILGNMIAPSVANVLINNSDFADLLLYFRSTDKAYCLYDGFSYEIRPYDKPIVWERYRMNETLFLKHAENFSKHISQTKYDIDYFEPEQEVLMKIPKLLSKYLEPIEWIESNINILSDAELGRILVTIGELLLKDIKNKITQQVIDEKNSLSKMQKLSDDSSWIVVAEGTLQVCVGYLEGNNITIEELYSLLDSEDYSDIVELTGTIKDPDSLVIIGYIIHITSYILTLAFYKEEGKDCSLPEILDSFQGEELSEKFIKFLLDMIQDKLMDKVKFLDCIKNTQLSY